MGPMGNGTAVIGTAGEFFRPAGCHRPIHVGRPPGIGAARPAPTECKVRPLGMGPVLAEQSLRPAGTGFEFHLDGATFISHHPIRP